MAQETSALEGLVLEPLPGLNLEDSASIPELLLAGQLNCSTVWRQLSDYARARFSLNSERLF